MTKFHVEKEIVELSRTTNGRKLLILTAWGNGDAKLDLRQWYLDETTGEELPGKGLALTEREAQTLSVALSAFLSNDGGEGDGE